MDRLIYTAMTGAKHVMLQLANNNHNLANISTAGFKGDYDVFRSLPLTGPGYQTRVYVEEQRVGADYAPGSLLFTGRELDLAINGDGFIAVQAADGTEAYTRSGDLRVTTAGLVETGAGHPVFGETGIVSIPPFEKLEIGIDGTISIRPLGQDVSTLAVVDRVRLVNPPIDQLVKRNDGLFQVRSLEPQPADAAVTVTSGSLEASNVNAVDAMVNMIQLSRQFEMNVKMMEQAENTDRASASLMRLAQG